MLQLLEVKGKVAVADWGDRGVVCLIKCFREFILRKAIVIGIHALLSLYRFTGLMVRDDWHLMWLFPYRDLLYVPKLWCYDSKTADLKTQAFAVEYENQTG